MLTLDEIREITINHAVAREAHDQASQRLADSLETKKGFEQKALVLFGAYITLALALFGAVAVVMKGGAPVVSPWPFAVAGVFYVIGAGVLVWVLLDQDYGALGSAPEFWLQRGTLNGDASALPRLLAYLTYYHHERIAAAHASNESKRAGLRVAIFLGVGGPIALVLLAWFIPAGG